MALDSKRHTPVLGSVRKGTWAVGSDRVRSGSSPGSSPRKGRAPIRSGRAGLGQSGQARPGRSGQVRSRSSPGRSPCGRRAPGAWATRARRCAEGKAAPARTAPRAPPAHQAFTNYVRVGGSGGVIGDALWNACELAADDCEVSCMFVWGALLTNSTVESGTLQTRPGPGSEASAAATECVACLATWPLPAEYIRLGQPASTQPERLQGAERGNGRGREQSHQSRKGSWERKGKQATRPIRESGCLRVKKGMQQVMT
eukprot:352701-Chlamydomonas_euryale.AAC.2